MISVRQTHTSIVDQLFWASKDWLIDLGWSNMAKEARVASDDELRQAASGRAAATRPLPGGTGPARGREQEQRAELERNGTLPRCETVVAIARVLDVSADYLLGLSDDLATVAPQVTVS